MLRLYGNIFGEDHPQVAVMHNNLADLHMRWFSESTPHDAQKHYNEAVSHYEQALTIYAQTLPNAPKKTLIENVLRRLQDHNPFYEKKRKREKEKSAKDDQKKKRNRKIF
jgi:hypothetical protein